MRSIFRELHELRFTEDNMKPKRKVTVREPVQRGYVPLTPPIDESYELELYGEASVDGETGFAHRGNVGDRK